MESDLILIGVINRFIGCFSKRIVRATHLDHTEYPFVAMDTRQVFQQLMFVAGYIESRQGEAPVSFVDIGCGFGNVMLFAEQFGFDVYGIEKDPASIQVALDFFEPHRLIHADIRSYDNYQQFDVIYYFCPLTEGEREFEEFLEDRIKKGAILIANYKRSHSIESDERFRRLHDELPVYEKISF